MIKRVCETDLGIVSQCCEPRQAVKLNRQYLENLSLKINNKVHLSEFHVDLSSVVGVGVVVLFILLYLLI